MARILCGLYSAQVPWTDILRNIVCSCYTFHGREDLIPDYRPAFPPDYAADLMPDYRSDCGGADDTPEGVVQGLHCPDEILSFVRLGEGGEAEGEGGVELVSLQEGGPQTPRLMHGSVSHSGL